MRNKIIVITGATGGLGNVVTRSIVQQGALVTAIARNKGKLLELQNSVKDLPGKLEIFPVDLNNPANVKSTFAAINGKFGRIDVLVHLAGGYAGGKSIAETDDNMWQDMLNQNLTVAFYCCREAMRYMGRQHSGKIITISAYAAMQPKANRAAYIVSKAGLISLTRTVAEEGKAVNVQANCIAPGIILTEANKNAMPNADVSKWIKPAQIVETIAFLCSPHADVITGSVIEMP